MRRALVLALCLWCVLTPSPAAAQAPAAPAPADWRFGVVEAPESPADAVALGAAWTRVRFQWAEVQADGPADWSPPVSDAALAAEVAAGRDVIGMLIGIPDWARGAELLPAGLYLPPEDPGNLWAGFVRQAASRYAGVIDHWIIWNEPDVWDKAAPGHTWDGDEADFLQLQRVAYETVKSVNPQAVVHLAAMTYFWDAQFGREQYLDRLLDVIVADPDASANDHYFDVATAHLYFQPTAVYDVLVAFREIMADHGLDKPIWLVETNAPPSTDPSWTVSSVTLNVTLEEQAFFMPQALAAALAAGAERVAIYKLKDTDTDAVANPEPFGLVRQDGTRRPAFAAAQRTFALLAGVTAAERQRWDAVGQIRLTQADRLTTVIFSRLPAPQVAFVRARGATARLLNLTGDETLLTSEAGLFRVPLPPALCAQSIGDYCMIGGETLFLIQARDGGPPPSNPPAALLTPTPRLTATPTATATFPATPTATETPVPIVTTAPAPSASPPSVATATALAANPPPNPPPPGGSSPGLWLLGVGLALGAGLAAIAWRRRE